MPIFEFRCKSCDSQFERLVRTTDTDAIACPSCESEQVSRLFSTFASKGSKETAAVGAAPRSSGGGCGPSCGCHH
jgi:putative FmdB family regulatory protein